MHTELSELSIREAKGQDAVPACHILRRSIEEDASPAMGQYDPALCKSLGDEAPERVRKWIESPEYYSVVAENADGELVGFSLLARTGELKLCYVLPEVKQQGVGARMLTSIEHQAFAVWGLVQVHLSATDAVASFYQALGYRVQGAGAATQQSLVELVKIKP